MPIFDNGDDDDDYDDDDEDYDDESAVLSPKQIRCIFHPNWPLSNRLATSEAKLTLPFSQSISVVTDHSVHVSKMRA